MNFIKDYFVPVLFVLFTFGLLVVNAQQLAWTGAAGDGDLFNPNNYNQSSIPNATNHLSIQRFDSNITLYIYPNGTSPRQVGSIDFLVNNGKFVFPRGSSGIQFVHQGFASNWQSSLTATGDLIFEIDSDVLTSWIDQLPVLNFDVNQILIRSGQFTLQLNGQLTRPQTLTFGDPTVNTTQCPQFTYQIPWFIGTNSSQILDISRLISQPSATPCSGPFQLLIRHLSLIPSIKSCLSQCNNISIDCCLLSLNFLGSVNISRDFQFQNQSQPIPILSFVTFNFGVPVYISDRVTFTLNGYSFHLNGNFMLGVGSVFQVVASGSMLNVASSVNIGGTVQGTSNSSFIVNGPTSNIFINSTASLTNLKLDFFGTTYIDSGANIANCSLYLAGNLIVPFDSLITLDQFILRASLNFLGQLQVRQLLANVPNPTISVLDQSTLVVTEYIQPGIVVNLQTENSFLAIVKSSAISNFVNVTGLGTLELRTDTYVLPTTGSKIAIGLGATVVFNDSNIVSRSLIINGGSINSPFPLTFQAPVTLRLSGEDFILNVTGNSTFNNLTIALFNRNGSVILPSGTVLSGSIFVNSPPNVVLTISGDGVLDLSKGLTTISGHLRINCTVTGITTNNPLNLRTGVTVEFLKMTSLPALTLNGGTFRTGLTNFTIDTLNWIDGTIDGVTVFVQSLTVSGSNAKILDNTRLIVQQLNLVSGSLVGFSSTSSGTLIFQGNLTLNENTGLDCGGVTLINEGVIEIGSSGILTCNTLRSEQGFSKKRSIFQYPSLTTPRISLYDGTIQTSSFTNNGLIEGYGTIVGTVYNEIQGVIYVGNVSTLQSLGKVLTINGALTQNGNVTVTIGGSNTRDINFLQIIGQVDLGGWINVIFTFDTTSVDPATVSYLVTTYNRRTNTYSNSAFFNVSPTRPAFLNTTDSATYVQFEGCYQYSNSCDICPTSKFDGCVWCPVGDPKFYCRTTAFCSADQRVSTCPNALLALLVIPAVLVLGAAIFLIIFFARRAKHAGRGGDKALLKRKPGPPDFASIAFGSYMWEGRLNKKDKERVTSFEKLRNLLLQDDMEVVLASCESDIVNANNVEMVSQSITYIYENAGRFIKLLHELIKREVANTQQEGTLFRGNTPASASWKYYSKLVGLEYLWNTISDEIYLLIEKTSKGEISTEMDPVLLGETDNIKVNKYQLMLTAQQILSKITHSVDKMPLAMRAALHLLQEEVVKKFPNNRHTCVGGWIFLRFFNPAINLPEYYGLSRKQPSKEARRVFVLVTKTLQSLANGVKLGAKEPYMQSLNPFIEENQEEINQFFDRIATLPEGQTIDNITPVEIPENVLLISVVEFHRHIYNNLNKIKEKLSQPKAQQLEEVMREIGDPVRVEVEEKKPE